MNTINWWNHGGPTAVLFTIQWSNSHFEAGKNLVHVSQKPVLNYTSDVMELDVLGHFPGLIMMWVPHLKLYLLNSQQN